MLKTKSITIGTLEDLFGDTQRSAGGMERLIWTKAFAGKFDRVGVSILPQFRIPASDMPGSEIFFYHSELLKRFTSEPTPTQTALLEAIRLEMSEKGCDVIYLNVEWENGKWRTLRIIQRANHLSFYLE